MTASASRMTTGFVLLAAALPGLLFAPVFGLGALVVPIALVLVVCFAVTELCARVPALGSWRPVLSLVVGLLALAETQLADTTAGGVPTGATLRALVAGATRSWQLTLQSTWPARPDASLLLFVPLAVLFAAVLGVELLRWPAASLVPGLALLGLSQAYVASSGPLATVAGLGFAAIAAGLFMVSRRARPSRRAATALLLVVPTLLASTAAAIAVTAVDQGRQPALSVHQNHSVPIPPERITNPLDEVAARLRKPDQPVFSYTSAGQVDRWRLVVLDDFDGVGWKPDDDYRRMGATLALAPSVTVPTTEHSAQVTGAPAGPWLPSQAMPAAVTGTAPLIDPASGTLLAPDGAGATYGLSWREPQVDPATLADAAVDPGLSSGDDLGVIPPGIADLARTATGGLRPSFRSALVLEQYLSQHYQVATGADLPTGNGWPQLRRFLLDTKRGTSEQFAASYVALAKIVGIPARLAVGFRGPKAPASGPVVVRNADVLAWPEVAVAGVGWVPLDPTGAASGSGASSTGLAAVAAKARASLPPPQELRDPPLPAARAVAGSVGGGGLSFSIPVLPIALILLGLIVAVTAGIPLGKSVRTRRRRRRTGAAGVVAAWQEARDLLRAHGVPFTPGMTIRDLAAEAAPTMDESVVDGLRWLALQVDTALWSGSGADNGTTAQAWSAVKAIRRGLAGRPRAERLRALFNPRVLRTPPVPALP
jgi:transglutaminase-like putative cysteine protease